MDSSELLASEKQAMKERLAQRLSQRQPDHAAQGTASPVNALMIDRTDDYSIINKAWAISAFYVPRSIRPVIGPIIMALRRLAMWAVRGYVESGWALQTAYNGSVTRILNAVAHQVNGLGAAVRRAEERNDILQSQVESLQAQAADIRVNRVAATPDHTDAINHLQSLVQQLELRAAAPDAGAKRAEQAGEVQELAAVIQLLQQQVEDLRIDRQAMNQAVDQAVRQHAAEAEGAVAVALASEGRLGAGLVHVYRALRAEGDRSDMLQLAGDIFRQQAGRLLGRSAGHRLSVVIIIQNLLRDGLIEAINKEAWQHFDRMKLAGDADVHLVSIEEAHYLQSRTEANPHPEVHGAAVGEIPRVLAALAPDVVHVYEASPDLIFECPVLLDYPGVVTATANAPLTWMDEEKVKRLGHLVDHGRYRLVVESNRAQANAEARGVGASVVIRPLLSASGRTLALPEGFTIGFASAPMQRQHWGPRGVDLILAAAAQHKDIRFLLAWRDPETLGELNRLVKEQDLANVEIRPGYIDMEAFYGDVNVVLLPFTSTVDTHACPLSAVEGLAFGRTVVCTSVTGIADLVAEHRLGVVSEPTAEGLNDAIRRVRAEMGDLVQGLSDRVVEAFPSSGYDAAYQALYQELAAGPHGLTLDQWADECSAAGKLLVLGRQQLSAYYQDDSVAQNYDAERFSRFPMNCYDLFERESVKMLIQAAFPNRNNLRLLDIATGTGRILKELIPFGLCTGIDASHSMLQLAVAETADAGGVTFVKGDFFETTLDGRYDVITSFRYIRHFTYAERTQLYSRIRQRLSQGGICILDFPNRAVEVRLRNRGGWGHFPIYDVFWTLPEITHELGRNGFTLFHALPIGVGLLGDETGLHDEPVSWAVSFTAQ